MGFEVERVEGEGGGAVEGCGAVVFWFGADVKPITYQRNGRDVRSSR